MTRRCPVRRGGGGRRGAPTLLARREAPPLARREAPPLGWREAPPQRLGSTFVRQPRRTPKSCHLGGFNYSPRGNSVVIVLNGQWLEASSASAWGTGVG